ncbi:type VII secretion protein EssA [Oceanobacillus kimchii]|uniref:type VII secretion protein EssA n=1 Tax=Oceanobacillus kimchii TaxID=746691 RepID=UPI0021A46739|nr:type VII secretion protein EssA [Oceanobacillus kimchii]MCT1576503.1 type VII secretion protein EssA [Oceanobacillus kimchii]MCT2136139.1 type VII secretion protein EssA [Oceanobacillus kimchii]
MKTKLKLVNLAFVSSMILLILLPIGVSAESGSIKDGSLQMQIDRIIKDKDEKNEMRETELERIFPSLFTLETSQEINEKVNAEEDKIEYIEQNLFSEDVEGNVAIQEVKDSLFQSDYESVAASSSNAEEESSSSSSSNIILMTFAGIAVALCGGLYVLMQRLLD